MSDFGLFEADEVAQNEPRRQARTAARQLEAAIDVVRSQFGRFLMGATGIDEFGDRWHYSKADIRQAVEPYVFPNTGTMRRLHNALKQDWKVAHPYKLAEDRDAPIQDIDETYHPSGGNLIPEGDFEGYKNSVDQNAPAKVQRDFGRGGDTGSDKHARRLTASDQCVDDEGHVFPDGAYNCPKCGIDWDEAGTPEELHRWRDIGSAGLADALGDHDYWGDDGDLKEARRRQAGGEVCAVCHEPVEGSGRSWTHKHGDEYCGTGDGSTAYPKSLYDSDNKKEAAKLVADIYTDFARSNGLRVASLDTLDAYASTGIHEADYRLLQNLIVAACECDDEDEDSDDDSEAPSESESDDSDSDDDSDEDYDFGGEDAAEGESEDSEDDDETDDSGASETESGDDEDEDYGFGGEDDQGGYGAEEEQGGEQYTVPEHAPQLPPEMMAEIPQDDAGGSAPVPPEVIDSLLGLPEGTIEQLLLEEVEQGGGDPGMSGGPMPGGGGDDFFGGGGGDPEQEPPRVARRRTARERECDICKYEDGDPGVPAVVDGKTIHGPWANMCEDHFQSHGVGMGTGRGQRFQSRRSPARLFWAAEDDSESSSSESSGGDSSGGGQQAAPAQDPNAAAGMDPNAMMGGGMMPPPGSQAVAPPTPPMPLENQPAEDALLDTAGQAIMQMIDRETQEYQQIIDPLSQALQAIQFAQQVEQSEHPLDVTPQQGTVDVSPAAAPGGAAAQQQPMQQQAMRRQAKIETALRNAAALIAHRYRLSAIGHQMLVEATLGRRGYEHVVEALKLVPADFRKAAAIHMAHLFAAGNQRFNKDVFLKTVMASNPRDRAWDAWASGRDRGDAEHKRQDLEDRGYDDEDDEGRTASRGRLPFELPRRQAGETWTNTSLLDEFEFPNPGVPEITDKHTVNDLPKMNGGHVSSLRGGASQKAVDRFQRWLEHQRQRGLTTTQGEAGVHNFLQTSKPGKQKVGDEAAGMIHREQGLTPDAPRVPRAKPMKAVNPTLKGKGGGGTPKAAPKTASFFTRKVPGWRWDDHLNGYISKEGKAFTCSCGQKVAAPSYKTCGCGKIWNVYAIGDTHHVASDTADMFIAREIPVRENVIMANKKLAGNAEKSHQELLAMIDKLADWTKYDDDVDPVVKTYGKPKPPSTKIPKQPKDWTSREFTGPDKGQWREPEGTELPRTKRKKR